MKYRIIEKRCDDGLPYYIAQHLEDGIWKTLEEYGRGVMAPMRTPIHFSSARKAKAALRKRAKAERHKHMSAVVMEGEM